MEAAAIIRETATVLGVGDFLFPIVLGRTPPNKDLHRGVGKGGVCGWNHRSGGGGGGVFQWHHALRKLLLFLQIACAW